MNEITITINREVTLNELIELQGLLEIQATNERYTNTSIEIDGDHAKIGVDIDEWGNVTLL